MAILDFSTRVYVAGHRGLVGKALLRALDHRGIENVLTADRRELDLRDPHQVAAWFGQHRPEVVIHAAGLVGGILANSTRPADFLHDNALMALNVLQAAHEAGCQKLLYLGSSCIYPRDCPQPIQESSLLAGPLEMTNRSYALAKIAGVIGCAAYREQYGCNFISAMPTNLYGPGDNFHPENSHVLPGLIQRFHAAKLSDEPQVSVWGSGRPRREFLHVDDLAAACLFLVDNYSESETVNVGTGSDVTIAEVAQTIRDIVHPSAEISFDASKPDGTPRKLLDTTRLNSLGWTPSIKLQDGLEETYRWYVTHSV